MNKFSFALVFISLTALFVYINSESKNNPIETYPVPFVEDVADITVSDIETYLTLRIEKSKSIREELFEKVDKRIGNLTGEYEAVKKTAEKTAIELNDDNYKIYKLNRNLYPEITKFLSKKQKRRLAQMRRHGYLDENISAKGKIKGYAVKTDTTIKIPLTLTP